MGFFSKLSHDEKFELLKIARKTIAQKLEGNDFQVKPDSENLNKKAGVFVTLKKSGQLRGCIGNFSDDEKIYQNVQKMAISAAFDDPRFNQLQTDELKEIQIEVSVLSGLKPIKAEEIEIGKHGLQLSAGFHRGVLLPQVPVEWGWDKEEYLNNLCLKAGLPQESWKEKGVMLQAFTAQVFSEKEFHLS
ncbi:MAG: AmmeMemoRadiSam system protein A [Deltaproteobacteria bacterium]|jgi:AmmeMemoRadiSam system protein A|nr:AmmeMemoRadiSam system protein A [Deltaproteobacteria bacterium]